MEKYIVIEEKLLRYNMIIMKHDIPRILEEYQVRKFKSGA